MVLRRTRRGQRITADHDSLKIDLLNYLTAGGSPHEAQGSVQNPLPKTLVSLFDLDGNVWSPDDDGAPIPPGLTSVPSVPYCIQSRPVLLDHENNVYGGTELFRDETVYFPAAELADEVGYRRVQATYNEQSGRWEAEPIQPVTQGWFELTEELNIFDSANAYRLAFNEATMSYDRVSDSAETVYDFVASSWGLPGEVVFCRRIRQTVSGLSSSSGSPPSSSAGETSEWFWEVIKGGASWHRADLVEDLLAREAAEADVIAWNPCRGEAQSVRVVVHDDFLLDGQRLIAGARVGINYRIECPEAEPNGNGDSSSSSGEGGGSSSSSGEASGTLLGRWYATEARC